MDVSVSWFESVTPIVAAWAGTMALLFRMGWRVRPRRSAAVSTTLRREGGFDYTLNLVVTLPILAVLVVVAIETTILLSTKIGTAYAAYAAARAAQAWDFYGPAPRQGAARRAALLAVAPFSRGLALPGQPPGGDDRRTAADYAALYGRAVGGPVRPTFLANQYLRAAAATRVEILDPGDAATPVLTAAVSYAYPFRFRLAALLFADAVDPASGESFRMIRTTVALPRQEVLDDPSVLGPAPDPGP